MVPGASASGTMTSEDGDVIVGLNVFNIQRFSGNDGPGIRTTVFLKGCPLHCLWCHNPESLSSQPDLLYDSDKCIGCLQCVDVCRNHCHDKSNGKHIFIRDHCVLCGKCTEVCPDALRVFGKEIDDDDLIKAILEDRMFYEQSGGGVTFSGGEPLLQIDGLFQIIRRLRLEKIHIAIETSGYTSEEKLHSLAKLVDLFLYDYKLTDNSLHKKYTGVSNDLILRNLYELDRMGAKIRLRCPIIPGINDTEDHFIGIINVAKQMQNLSGIDIEPYHRMGVKKYESLQKGYLLQNTEELKEEDVKRIIAFISTQSSVPVRKA